MGLLDRKPPEPDPVKVEIEQKVQEIERRKQRNEDRLRSLARRVRQSLS